MSEVIAQRDVDAVRELILARDPIHAEHLPVDRLHGAWIETLRNARRSFGLCTGGSTGADKGCDQAQTDQ